MRKGRSTTASAQCSWPTLVAVVLCSVVVLVLTLFVRLWISSQIGEPTPFVKPARVEGRTIEVSYTGSACQEKSRLEIEESSERVIVTVYAKESSSCSDIGVEYTLTGSMSSLLGDRELIDDACQIPENAIHIDCEFP